MCQKLTRVPLKSKTVDKTTSVLKVLIEMSEGNTVLYFFVPVSSVVLYLSGFT